MNFKTLILPPRNEGHKQIDKKRFSFPLPEYKIQKTLLSSRCLSYTYRQQWCTLSAVSDPVGYNRKKYHSLLCWMGTRKGTKLKIAKLTWYP